MIRLFICETHQDRRPDFATTRGTPDTDEGGSGASCSVQTMRRRQKNSLQTAFRRGADDGRKAGVKQLVAVVAISPCIRASTVIPQGNASARSKSNRPPTARAIATTTIETFGRLHRRWARLQPSLAAVVFRRQSMPCNFTPQSMGASTCAPVRYNVEP